MCILKFKQFQVSYNKIWGVYALSKAYAKVLVLGLTGEAALLRRFNR